MMGIIASGGDPANLGFSESNKDILTKIRKHIKYKEKFDWVKIEFWLEIQKEMGTNKFSPKYVEGVHWIKDYNFDKVNKSILKDINAFIARVDRKIEYIINSSKE